MARKLYTTALGRGVKGLMAIPTGCGAGFYTLDDPPVTESTRVQALTAKQT